MTRIAYKIPAAAEQVSVSEATIRRAIHATDPAAYPPPLKAKRAGEDGKRAEYRVLHSDLVEWAESLEDA